MATEERHRPCYICEPRYVANASIGNNTVPICTICAWQYKIVTDQEIEEASRQNEMLDKSAPVTVSDINNAWSSVDTDSFSFDFKDGT
jgi:hypothetical protein